MQSPANQVAKKILLFYFAVVVGYFLLGLVFGYIGLWLSCQGGLYSCPDLARYLSDPWLFSNTLYWPLLFLDGLDKSNWFF